MKPTFFLTKLLFAALLFCLVKQTTAKGIDFCRNENHSLVWGSSSCELMLCGLNVKQNYHFSIDRGNHLTNLNISVVKQKDETCANSKDCEIDYCISGGIPPYTVRLINADQLVIETRFLNAPGYDQFFKLTPSFYRLVVTDAKGSEQSCDRFLKRAEPLVWNDPIISDETDLDKKDGNIIINISGGKLPLTYSLMRNDSVLYKEQNKMISGLASGVYDLIIKDTNGCELKKEVKVGSKLNLSAEYLQSKSKQRLEKAKQLLDYNKSELKLKSKKYNLARFSTQGIATIGGIASILVPDRAKEIVAGISAGSTLIFDLLTNMQKYENEIEVRKKIHKKLNDQLTAFKKAWPPENFNKQVFSLEDYRRFIIDLQLLAAVTDECEVLSENIEQQNK